MSSSILNPIRQIFSQLVKTGFNTVLSKATIISAGDGKVTAEMVVSQEHVNSHGTLHGGMTATIVDEISALALDASVLTLAAKQSTPPSGPSGSQAVSVDLSVSFLNSVKKGETILIEAETQKRGKTIAFLVVKIFNKSNGKLIATGNHTTINIRPKAE